MNIDKVNKEFHAWLRDEAEGWVRGAAQSDTVYQAVRVAYEGVKKLHYHDSTRESEMYECPHCKKKLKESDVLAIALREGRASLKPKVPNAVKGRPYKLRTIRHKPPEKG